jgi:amidase
MGPANSEPLLVSLAADLEAVGGWAAKQPAVWWNAEADAVRRDDRRESKA